MDKVQADQAAFEVKRDFGWESRVAARGTKAKGYMVVITGYPKIPLPMRLIERADSFNAFVEIYALSRQRIQVVFY